MYRSCGQKLRRLADACPEDKKIGTSDGTGTYRMKATIGSTVPSKILKELMSRPRGTARAAAMRNATPMRAILAST